MKTSEVLFGAIDVLRESGWCKDAFERDGAHCMLGAVIAAFAAVADDPVVAAIAALTCFGLAGERAGAKTDGSGTFAAFFIDELCRLNSTTLTECPP